MFVSVVDAPNGHPPLTLRQEGPKKIFKKRFNVAASRARNHMWVVHSLNPAIDLQPSDYRRQIIEHALDPKAWERDLQKRQARDNARTKGFEESVQQLLVERGYNVIPRHQAGAYTIDLVVIGKASRLAIECDGDQFHSVEKLQEDLERQAVLERLGWTFVRVRGSLFFRDEMRALEPVFRRLQKLNITPTIPEKSAAAAGPVANEIVNKVTTRAGQLRTAWGSHPTVRSKPAAKTK
jgi:very-short-patch-repair endonuclease